VPAIKTIRARTREEWRTWLEAHHDTAPEVWLRFAKVHSGRPSVRYAEAVEEAICFGWIDTTVRRIDDVHYAQRFTPRLDVRNWSAVNLRRFENMVAEGRMTAAGRAKLPENFVPKPPRHPTGAPVPDAIARRFKADPVAWRFFESLAPGYRRDYVRFVTEAKREDTRERRLVEAARRLRAGYKRVYDIGRDEP
jgi:uncharacterized protein YdeI (YjbR/CyaY-like superfamily)